MHNELLKMERVEWIMISWRKKTMILLTRLLENIEQEMTMLHVTEKKSTRNEEKRKILKLVIFIPFYIFRVTWN